MTTRQRVQMIVAIVACLIVAGGLMAGIAVFLLDQLGLIGR
jgi:hypothetical protein